MLPKYRFYINAEGENQRLANPIWKDDLAVEWKLESQEWFYRSELSGSLDFERGDYDYIMAKAFGTMFYVEIQISDNGTGWASYWKGKFTLTDCKVNKSSGIITVKPQADDKYAKILAGMDKEFDLIKLAPEINRIRLNRRPALQVFDGASETITTIFGNLSFETDVTLPSDGVQTFIRDNCHFQVLDNIIELQFYDVVSPFTPYFAEPFSGEITGDGSILTNATDQYFIEYYDALFREGLAIYSRSQPGVMRWKYEQDKSDEGAAIFPSDLHFEPQTTGDPSLDAHCYDHSLYSRVICNKATANGGDTYKIPTDDIVDYNRNYTRCYPYDANDMLVRTDRKSNDPTEWGFDESTGKYYLPPNDTDMFIPVGRNMWGNYSVWLEKTNDYIAIENDATYEFTLNDAYPLHSCIQVLLNEIDPTIHFSNTAAYSDFLYSGADALQGRNNGLWLTPKSNITNGEYQTPAQKAPVTLKDILSMLKNTYRCYWFLGTVNNQTALRIEHVQYFLNGGSYVGSPAVGIDLTTMANKRNGKKWAFDAETYEYEKVEMPERYQFGWMDENVTEFFKGQPIVMVSNFVEQGKVEEINVANFTSDIDIMQLNPSGISQDGFALINALPDGNDLYVPIVTFPYGGYSYRAQNAYLSFHMLQWAYWPYNMPSKHIQIEGDDLSPAGVTVSRNKKQTVNIPLGISDPNMMQLVKTNLGSGQIQQTSIRLTSRMAKTQLRYDTE